MEFNKLSHTRRTVRAFTSEPVKQETLETIIQAGLAAPSPNNSTPWLISVVTETGTIKKMRDAVDEKLTQMFAGIKPANQQTLDKVKAFSTVFANAPVVLAIFSRPYSAPVHDLLADVNLSTEDISELRRHPELQATGALVQNILLAATEAGLGSCWISGALVARRELETILGAKDMRLETMVALGHKEGSVSPKEPLNLKNFVNFIS